MKNFLLESRIVKLVQELWKNKFTSLLIQLVFLLLFPIIFSKEFALFIFFCLPIYLLIINFIYFPKEFNHKMNFLYLRLVCFPCFFYIISQLLPQFSQLQICLLKIAIFLNIIFLSESILEYRHHFLDKIITNKDNTKEINETAINLDIIYGSISIYLLYGILCFFIYLIIGVSQEDAFCFSPEYCISTIQIIRQPFDLLYFSFKTLTTVGYGDIYPAHIAAKIFSNLEGILGVMFPAVFIARLVGNFKKSDNDEG